MFHRAFATAALVGLLAISSSASADETSTTVITALQSDSVTGRFFIHALFACSFSGGTGRVTRSRADIIDTIGVGATADRRREAISLLTAAFLAGKQVSLVLRRSDTDGTHCRVYSVSIL